LSADPAAGLTLINTYDYCRGNPVRLVDPSGTQPAPDQETFNRVDADHNGKLNLSEVVSGANCMTPEASDKFLLSQSPNTFTNDGWLARNILLEPYFAAGRRADEQKRNAVFMWSDGSQSTSEQRENHLFLDEFYNGAAIRNGLGFGAIYYGATGDRGGAEILNGLASSAGGMAGDAAHYRATGSGLVAASKPSIAPPSRTAPSATAAPTRAPGPSSPVRLDPETGLPRQLWGTKVGPAYSSFEEAFGTGNHIMEVIVRQHGKEIARWWEASEGTVEAGGHTEQKALSRVALDPSVELELRGWHPPCPYGSGCMNTMTHVANTTGGRIIYRTASGRQPTYVFHRE
jgi:hypothetical protein